jgi:hypothetical protein
MEAGAHFPTESAEARRAERDERARSDAGWLNFACAYLFVAGGMSVIWGIVALANKSAFKEDSLVWSKLGTWGTAALVVGALEMLAAALLYRRRFSGQWLAGILALLAVFVHFLALGAYPVWSVMAIVANGLVLWAITVHGEEIE